MDDQFGGGRPVMGSDYTLGAALDGLRVVALEQAVALPFTTFILAELGADVIKLERPTGDVIRGWDNVVDGLSAGFVWLNAGKRDVSVDLSTETGRSVARRIASEADVFVENFAPGVAERLGLAYDDVRLVNPSVVYCSLSGFGQSGPFRDRKAYDLIVQGESGLLLTNGLPDAPAKIGIPVTDLIGGSTAAILILAALRERDHTGTGRYLDVAMLDSVMPWLGYYPHHVWHSGQEPARSGLRHQYTVPYGPYEAADGKCVNFAVASPEHWHLFCTEVVKHPEWEADPRFATSEARTLHRTDLEPLVEEAIAAQSTEIWEERLGNAGIPFGEVRTISEALDHPQIAYRQMVVDVTTPSGTVPAIRFPGSTHDRARRVPALGEHTRQVLTECGYMPNEVGALIADGSVIAGDISSPCRDEAD